MTHVARIFTGELISGVEAGDLKDSLQVHSGEQRIGLTQKLVVVEKLLKHAWVNEQGGLDLRRLGGQQLQQGCLQFAQQCFRRRGLCDFKGDAVSNVFCPGERTKVQADHGPLQPETGVGNDLSLGWGQDLRELAF